MSQRSTCDDEAPKRRELSGWQLTFITIISIVWATFHLVVASGFYIPAPTVLRAIHLGFALIMVFMLAPAFRSSAIAKPTIIDWVLIALSVGTMGYMVLRYESLVRMGGNYSQVDIWVGIVGTLLLYEAARRIVSPALVILATVALLYTFFGRSLPEPFTHSGFGIERVVQHLFLSGEGIFGFILGVSAEIIIVFVLFGSVLEGVGVADFFYKLANSLAGRSRGGPAKIAVITSSLMGMVSGETSANVATCGSFTIPLMKRVGYQPYFAAAVECAAAAGGQIMPPVMGATAFVIADSLGIPYVKLALAASIPAILYYVGVFATVHFRSVKLGLEGLPEKEIPSFMSTITGMYLMLPLAGIVVLLLFDFTPTLAAFWGGIVLAIIITSVKKETRLNITKIIAIMIKGTRTAMSLAVACALVGIIVGVSSLTGITMTIADLIFNAAGGTLFPALVMTAIVALILGMGVPTTAAYVLTAISAVPVLTRLGIPEVPAHLFVFYFGVLSALTPPVCTGAYTAAALAGADPNRTGFASVRIALSGFIAPFLFIYNTQLVLQGDTNWFSVAEPFLIASVGIVALSAALEGAFFGNFGWGVRICMGVAALMVIHPEKISSYLGLAILAGLLLYNYRTTEKAKIQQTQGMEGGLGG